MDVKIIIQPTTILIVTTSCKNITDKIVPNKDSVDKIKADLVCSTLDWQMVCSKNAMAVLNIPRYKAPIIPVGVALMCTCFVKICSKADNIKATTNCVTVST